MVNCGTLVFFHFGSILPKTRIFAPGPEKKKYSNLGIWTNMRLPRLTEIKSMLSLFQNGSKQQLQPQGSRVKIPALPFYGWYYVGQVKYSKMA